MEEKNLQKKNRRIPNPFGALPPDSTGEKIAPINFTVTENIEGSAKKDTSTSVSDTGAFVKKNNILEEQLKTSEPDVAIKPIKQATPVEKAPILKKEVGKVVAEIGVPKRKPAVSSIRTFHGDVSQTIREKKFSVSDIALAEQRRRLRRSPPTEKERDREPLNLKKIVGFLIGAVLLSSGAFGVYFVIDNIANTDQVQEFTYETLIFVNEQIEIPAKGLSRKRALELLNKTKNEVSLSLGEVADIRLVTNSTEQRTGLTSSEFLEILGARSSSSFKRSLLDQFMLGIHMFDEERYFLILKVSSFETAFAEMIRWENNLEDDLLFITRKVKTPSSTNHASSTVATTTPDERPIAEIKKSTFIDVVIKNRDARALFGGDDKPVFLYSFPDRDTLIITSNTNTLSEAFDRITSARFR